MRILPIEQLRTLQNPPPPYRPIPIHHNRAPLFPGPSLRALLLPVHAGTAQTTRQNLFHRLHKRAAHGRPLDQPQSLQIRKSDRDAVGWGGVLGLGLC
jgi:hypothetical protein